MASFASAMDHALFDVSVSIRRRGWVGGDYVRAHFVSLPPPPSLPDGTPLYVPSIDDLYATDWERA